jgi:hypothetical protein
MALPLIPLAVAAVARFIVKKGVTAAVKKYGKKAVTEAKKHVKDLTTPVREGVKQTKPGVRGMQNARQLGRQAALVGAGVGGTAVAMALKDKQNELKEKLAKAKEAEEKAKTEKARAKARADKEIINAALAKAMLEDKESSAPETSKRPVTRKEEKVIRPKTRPKDMMYGGMTTSKPRTGNTDYRMGGMFMKNGKK